MHPIWDREILGAKFMLCYQECQLHTSGSLHQVLPQQRICPCSSQPLSKGLHRSPLLIDEDDQRAWPPSTLQAKLCMYTEQISQMVPFYRKDCAHPIRKTCKERYGTFVERDTTVWKWRKRVVGNLAKVFDKLGIVLSENIWLEWYLRSLHHTLVKTYGGNDIWGLCIIL